MNFVELITSTILKAAHEISYPSIWSWRRVRRKKGRRERESKEKVGRKRMGREGREGRER